MRIPAVTVAAALFVAALPVLAQERIDWGAVDRHALAAPASVTSSVDRLAAYLSDGLDTDVEKARSAYRWVTDSVSYDVAAFFSGQTPDQSAGDVLSRRSAVCAGYSRLYAEICTRMGLTVEVVSGYAKGYGYSPGALFTRTNHDWNAVKIDGSWRLVDCTWGAGYVDGSRRFQKEFTEFFFLSPPEKLILSHFPEDARWQLLDSPWSQQQFLDGVFVYPSAYSLGVTARSHKSGVFSSSGEETLVFDADDDIVAHASVDGNDGATFIRAVDGGFEVLCAFASPGRHSLTIYAARRSASSSGFTGVVQYAVDVDKGLGPNAGFPATYDNYGRRRIALVEPLTRVLAAGSTVTFDLTVPEATKVAVISGGKWSYLAQGGERFHGSIPVAAGWVQVCAQFPQGGSFEGILTYEAK